MPDPDSWDPTCDVEQGGAKELDVVDIDDIGVVYAYEYGLDPPSELGTPREREEDEGSMQRFIQFAEELKVTLKKEVLEEVRESMVSVIMQQVSGLIEERLNECALPNDAKQDFGGSRSKSMKKSNTQESRGPKASGVSREKSMSFLVVDNMDKTKTDGTIMSVGELCQKTNSDGIPTLDARANELGAQDWVYNWAETMWDAMPFFGLGVMTPSDSLLVVLIAMINVAIQAAFIGLVGMNMTESTFHGDEIVGSLQDWRVSYAHNPDFADKFTSTPLGSDVCSQSTFLMQGAQQAALYSEILEYAQLFLGMPSGACLSVLAIFMWILTCLKELKRICLFTIGLWTPNSEDVGILGNDVKSSHVQIQERTILWVYGEATQKNYQIFLTRCRVAVLSVVVTLPRFIILLALGIVGTQFLVATTELDELILNCVALEVVLNVDELLFLIFVPDSAARMVRKTKPLRVPKLRGVQARIMPWLRVVVVIVLMSYICVFSLSPLIDTMNEVGRMMCGGKVDFLAVEMKFGAVVSGTPRTFGIDRQAYRYRAIYQRTGLETSLSSASRLYLEDSPFEFTRVQTLDTWRERDVADWATLYYDDDTFLPCVDQYWNTYRNPNLKSGFWAAMIEKANVQGASKCADVKHLCFSDAGDIGKAVRLLCPGTCGARDALSGLIMDLPVDGVPKECEKGFVQSLAMLPCTDYPLAVLTNVSNPIGQGWKNYGIGLDQVMLPTFMAMSLGNMTHFHMLRDQLWIGMSTYGCDFFSRQGPTQGKTVYLAATGAAYPVDFCDVSDTRLFGRRSIRSFCPQACECHTRVKQRYLAMGEEWDERTGLESQCPGVCWNSANTTR